MTIEFLNVWYFFYMLAAGGLIFGLYRVLRHRSAEVKSAVVLLLVLLNLGIHFAKLLIPPYSTNPDIAMREVWFINVCAVSVLFFPAFFLSKNKVLRDFMFYLGTLSGVLALLIPTEAMGKPPFAPDSIRFYLCHTLILAAPLLMVLLGVHRLNYRRIGGMPFVMMGYLLFIIVNQVLQSELGIVSLRGDDLLAVGYKNPSFIWGPTDEMAALFSIFTPDFMKTVPWGPMAGQEKYWPFFWMLPAVVVYFLALPALMCLPWEYAHIKADLTTLVGKLKRTAKGVFS
ncbi:MAG: hypothetical protein WDA00_07170 [Eubacteriales bacterium]